jgi:uncharacterized protein YndB with AHSA1/START domain
MARFTRTPDGRRLEVARDIDAPRDRVWEVFRDTETWAKWGPSLTAVESPTRLIHQGTEGRVRTVGGLWLPFRVTTCANYRWTWDVVNLPATGHRVEERAGASRAVIEVPVVAAPYVPVCERGLRRLEAVV